MKLYRNIPGKGTNHPHAKALGHLKSAHSALMNMNRKEALTHIGHAFRAAQATVGPSAPNNPNPTQSPAP